MWLIQSHARPSAAVCTTPNPRARARCAYASCASREVPAIITSVLGAEPARSTRSSTRAHAWRRCDETRGSPYPATTLTAGVGARSLPCPPDPLHARTHRAAHTRRTHETPTGCRSGYRDVGVRLSSPARCPRARPRGRIGPLERSEPNLYKTGSPHAFTYTLAADGGLPGQPEAWIRSSGATDATGIPSAQSSHRLLASGDQRRTWSQPGEVPDQPGYPARRHLPARQPVLALARGRDRHLPRPVPSADRILLPAHPPPTLEDLRRAPSSGCASQSSRSREGRADFEEGDRGQY